MHIGYFGDEYSHTYACASAQFTDAVLRGFDTVRGALAAVAEGSIDACVVPLENSVGGSVTEAVDGIGELRLKVRAEYVLPIHHCLIGVEGGKAADVRVVYSHPQALSQCRTFLAERLPQARAQAVAYTSEGLKLLGDKRCAAIARTAGKGQTVLQEHIEDSALNATRFAAVYRTATDAGDKASVLFAVKNEPGALLRVLRVFDDLHHILVTI